MPKSLNKVMLIGNLGKDPEVRYTTSGTAVASFSMATTSSFKDSSGEWKDKTEWHNITAWARLAEIAGEYLKKGSKVYIEGRLETQSWDDKQTGTKKYKTQIVAQELLMLDRKEGGGGEERDSQARGQDRGFDQRRGGSSSNEVSEDNPITDSDIPFILEDFTVLQCPRSWNKRRYA